MQIRFPGSSFKAGEVTISKGKCSAKSVLFNHALTEAQNSKLTQIVRLDGVMDGLLDLASKIREGTLTKEEASRQFVGLVIQKMNLKSHTKEAKKIETLVADAVEQDPNFVQKLETQLKKL